MHHVGITFTWMFFEGGGNILEEYSLSEIGAATWVTDMFFMKFS